MRLRKKSMRPPSFFLSPNNVLLITLLILITSFLVSSILRGVFSRRHVTSYFDVTEEQTVLKEKKIPSRDSGYELGKVPQSRVRDFPEDTPEM
jgi:hypothetical protein